MTKLLMVLAIALTSSVAFATKIQVLHSATTATGSSKGYSFSDALSFQARGATSAGAGAATIVIEGTNFERAAADGDWDTVGTITLTLSTTTSSDGFVVDGAGGKYLWYRARVSAISGTDASVDVNAAWGN